jgi:hypothetical protein
VVILVEEKLAGEDQEMENMGCFVEMIHMVYRKLNYFHYFWGYIQGLGVDPDWIERSDASGVSVGVPPTNEMKK